MASHGNCLLMVTVSFQILLVLWFWLLWLLLLLLSSLSTLKGNHHRPSYQSMRYMVTFFVGFRCWNVLTHYDSAAIFVLSLLTVGNTIQSLGLGMNAVFNELASSMEWVQRQNVPSSLKGREIRLINCPPKKYLSRWVSEVDHICALAFQGRSRWCWPKFTGEVLWGIKRWTSRL